MVYPFGSSDTVMVFVVVRLSQPLTTSFNVMSFVCRLGKLRYKKLFPTSPPTKCVNSGGYVQIYFAPDTCAAVYSSELFIHGSGLPVITGGAGTDLIMS